MSRDKERDQPLQRKQETTSTTTVKDQEDLNKRRAANTAPPEEAPKEEESEEDKKAREAAEGTRRGIILRLRERDGQLNEDETEELKKINEEEAKAGKAETKKE